MNKKALFMLSICQKAGKLVLGEFSVEKSIQNGSAKLVIIASDASENTKKKFQNKAFFYKIDAIVFCNKEEICEATGKFNRSVLAIVDEGLASKVKKDIEEFINK